MFRRSSLAALAALASCVGLSLLVSLAQAEPAAVATKKPAEKPAASPSTKPEGEAELHAPERTALDEYIARPEPAFSWKIVSEKKQENGAKSWQLLLVSQEWQGITWQHDVTVFEPKKLDVADKILIYNTGGQVVPAENILGPLLAEKAGARVAILWGVPNQPLFEGLREDDLIAHTYVRYFETKDPTWPLLFPMAKSMVKCMDALVELGKQEGWSPNVSQYLPTGGSKRGWTSYLAACVDKRVFAVAPIVIEIKMREQMKHQLEVLGTNTYKLAPYASRGLSDPKKFDTPEGRKLWEWVDPWMYRNRLTMPKLLIKATNDPWWLLDSMNVYWNDFKGPQHVLYFPNEVHELPNHRPQAASTVAAFFRRSTRGQELPKLSWQHDDGDKSLQLKVNSAETPATVKLWTAHSDTLDFRESKWESTEMVRDGEGYLGELPLPESGHSALFGEIEYYEGDDLKYSLSTQVRIR